MPCDDLNPRGTHWCQYEDGHDGPHSWAALCMCGHELQDHYHRLSPEHNCCRKVCDCDAFRLRVIPKREAEPVRAFDVDRETAEWLQWQRDKAADATRNRVYVPVTRAGYVAGVFSSRAAAEDQIQRLIDGGLKVAPSECAIWEYEMDVAT